MRGIIAFVLSFLCVSAFAAKPVRVACLGDSITRGAALEDPDHESFPAVLQGMLGDCYDVRNFGSDARVMVQTGDHPYMKEWRYDSLKTFLPDIVTIMLGTNDTKPENWDAHQFKNDYATMIRELKALPSHPDIYVCLPPPPYETKWGINDSTLVSGVIPIAKKLARRNRLEVIDLHTAMSGKPELFADKIHPNKEGAVFVAKMVYDSFKSDGRARKSRRSFN